MIGNSSAPALAKVVAVGGLMAAAAGGIYLLGSTNSKGDSDRAQVADTAVDAASRTAEVAATTGTPSSGLTPMSISGSAWVDARPATGVVRGFIDGVECGSAESVRPPDSYGTMFILEVRSNDQQPGCGADGAEVRLTLDDAEARETVTWQSGTSLSHRIVVGPEFDQYYGTFVSEGLSGAFTVEPIIDGIVCGTKIDPVLGSGPVWGFHVVVDSEELTPGCGREGATISFRIVEVSPSGATHEILPIELPSVTWAPGGPPVRIDEASAQLPTATP